MADAKLTQAVIRYREQRAKIKARQKQELNEELAPWAADVGDVILDLRRKSYTIQDVANEIGIQNRTFIYEMIEASKARTGLLDAPSPLPGEQGTTQDEEDDTEAYSIEWHDSENVTVTFGPDNEQYDIVIEDGIPSLPEEWGDHSKERRMLYKDIIAELKEGP